MLIPRFKWKRVPGLSRKSIIATSRKDYLDPKQIKTTIHVFRDVTREDLTRTLQQYRTKKLHNVTVIAGFNDHDATTNEFSNNWRNLINLIMSFINQLVIFFIQTFKCVTIVQSPI